MPATLKGGGKTRPWRSLINKFRSISISYEALKPLLRDKRREDLVATIDKSLLNEVLQILEKAEDIFDILEYSFVSTLQFVLPAFYKLQNFWCNLSALDSAAGRILKRNLVSALDTKLWDDITALHVAATYLDPSLKTFSFVRDTKERRSLSEQAVSIVKENAMSIAKELVYPQKESEDSDVEAMGNYEEEIEAECERVSKRLKHDPLEMLLMIANKENITAEVNEELRRYDAITGVNLTQAH